MPRLPLRRGNFTKTSLRLLAELFPIYFSNQVFSPLLSVCLHYECVFQNGPDRDRCVAALTSELDNDDSVITATSASTPPPPSSAPSMRRYSLQGRQQRLRRHSLVSSSGVSSMTAAGSINNNQRRRRNSCFALTHVNMNSNCENGQLTEIGSGLRRKSSSSSHCDLEFSGSSSTIPMVVLTPESPRTSPSSQVRTLFSPEGGGGDNGAFDDQGQLGHYHGQNEGRSGGGGFFIMGNSSNLTATCLDIDEEDLLNNNNGNSNDNENEAVTVTATSSEDDDGSGSSSGFSLSTATLSHGELRLMQSDSAAPVATTAFTRIRDANIANVVAI